MSDVQTDDIYRRPRAGQRAVPPRTAADAASAGAHQAPRDEDRADPIREDESDEVVTRKSRGERSVEWNHVPASYRRKGMDYQWFVTSVMNEPIDGSVLAEAHEGGWRPVRSADMPTMLAPGDKSDTINRRGQRLYQRPMHLTTEAKDEDYQAAEQQRRDRIQGALEGKPRDAEGVGNIRGVRAVPLQIDVQNEIGAYDTNPLRR